LGRSAPPLAGSGRDRHSPATNQSGPLRPVDPARPGARDARLQPPASRAVVASRSSRNPTPIQPAGIPKGCPS
jgi:hypothetical protein